MRLLAQLGAVLLVSFASSAVVGLAGWNVPATLVLGLVMAALSLWVYGKVVRWTERRDPAEIAVRGAVPALGRGFLIGGGMFAAVIANIAFLGGYEVLGMGSVGGAVALFGFQAAAVVSEELLFRGILFRFLERGIGTWAALLLSGVLFGAIHMMNPHATVWTSTAIAISAGFMLAAAYAATRNLWVPIGVHFGWNYVQGGIFGASVSGTEAPQGLLDSVTSGPLLVSGGEFGPEASAYAVLAGVVVTVAFMRLAKRRGNIVSRRRRSTPEAALVAQPSR
ncbi:hypothetical protein SAMN05216553_113169 [Lentzea fradiae]|uniref:CAAX prenyl protease 2/Lysostaphin resistance protein A-like domain-containing protein n=1 Tax=Lentzea fradiae TaxID=200378 RepID=A0A1G7Y9U3_9PSEU|nr:type II CAAX endopeptidase family protein [Lentzea fradiae]SDG93106.1 hypothetical protein SAMN05216553_113169 [Lentzea fradiae]